MIKNQILSGFYRVSLLLSLAAGALVIPGTVLAGDDGDRLIVKEVKWEAGDSKLKAAGKGNKRQTVSLVNAFNPSQVLGQEQIDDEEWKISSRQPSPVPCRVQVIQSDGQTDERDVENAPADCAPKDGSQPPVNVPPVADANGVSSTDTTTATITDPDQPPIGPNASINSTSQNGVPDLDMAVLEQPLTGNSGYQVFATNDLGMHCGDLDTRISSILPPFNVLHAMVIQRGDEPEILTPADGVDVVYSAASNANDPILTGIDSAGTGPVLSSMLSNGSVYKTNFWDIAASGSEPTALAAYRPFYPPGILDALTPVPDEGLPMPNVERLWLGDGLLTAEKQSMPGITYPYVDNRPQLFKLFTIDQPFFIDFPFGYISEGVNWYEAAGIPLTAFDDYGRENPWPLMRVQARSAEGQILASLDTVVPISGEANCGFCHSDPSDGGNGAATEALEQANLTVTLSIDDPQHGDNGNSVPEVVSKEWAADINLLRLHDLKHSTNLIMGTTQDSPPGSTPFKPVVCQTCHYTPALDLAQVGPRGPQNDDPLNSGDPSNGRDQVVNKSMSNVMHSHHGAIRVVDNPDETVSVVETGGRELFPAMPPAVDSNANLRDPLAAREVLMDTCYQCHPGRRTDCLRGAMASGGMLCQDCHGDMEQVGDDFSRDVAAAPPEAVGAFELADDFYTNPDTPRVPWANEPGCGSCHTGDARDNMHADGDTLGSPIDNIRLMQAYRIDDTKATPIVPANKRFAENSSGTGPQGNNPMLYRVSKGHEDVFCEACHGATHGIWPNKNPAANDNVAAMQLQGHTGTISECSTCHDPRAFEDSGSLELTMDGPHGMHAVGSHTWNKKHKEARTNGGDNCRTCHGNDGEGTVLSRIFKDRTLECKDNKGTFCADEGPELFPKGHQVGCADCHENEL
jgi:hypothetical protein